MKKRLGLLFCFLLITVLIGYPLYKKGEKAREEKYHLNSNYVDKTVTYKEKVTELREFYNNDDVVGIISIENTDFTYPILQGEDNDYYLAHNPDKTDSIAGAIMLDYRVNVDESDKILVFGHSSKSLDTPIEIIENYANEDYLNDHKYIYVDTLTASHKYQVFSTYVEVEDFDYMKINFKNLSEKLKHYQKLKDNSFYDTGVDVTENDRILVIQTCATDKKYSKYTNKYYLLIAKEV